MTPRHTLCALLLTLPLLAVTGCDTNPTTDNSTSTKSSSIQQDDTRLNTAVSDALQRDTLFAQSDISVASQQGQIRLNGTVASMQDKNRAGEIAKKVSGVTGVSNNLEIVTPGTTN